MAAAQAANWVLYNGVVYTGDGRTDRVTAVAVGGGRILWAGTDAEARAYAGPHTEVIDLRGRMVLPAFVESHNHPVWAMTLVASAPLYGLGDVEAYLQAVREFAQANPQRPVIHGAGWSSTLFPPGGPRRELLDTVVPDRPVVLSSEDGHSTWVNSRALELAGITAATPDPPGGVIERDADGSPSGTLKELAAEMLDAALPGFSDEDRLQGLRAYQQMAARAGITTSHDASLNAEFVAAYLALQAAGELRLRFRGAWTLDPTQGPEQVAAVTALRDVYRGPHFQINTAKIFVDGVIEAETGYLLQDYAHRPGYRGELLWQPDNLKAVCAACAAEGLQIHVHAIGDGATRVTLDAFEHAQRVTGRGDLRHIITHLQLVAPEDIPRMAALGVVAAAQPFWFRKDDYYHNLQVPYLGQERADREYPMRSLIDAGVLVTSSSDFPVTIPFDPLYGMEMGITRCGGGDNREALWPEERATLEEMIASYTRNGAYANFLEGQLGTITAGRLADLVVVERDLFATPPEELRHVPVLLTLFEGQAVHRDEAL